MNFTVSQAAQIDISNILNFTIENWGLPQAAKYQQIIDDGLDLIKVDPLNSISKKTDELKPHSRRLRVGKHHIYYMVENNWIVVLRVLHQQQKPKLHL